MLRTILLINLMLAAWGQSIAPAFEIASIKPSPQTELWNGFIQTPGGGRFEASHVTLKAMVAYAYDVRELYVAGGPGWIGSQPFEILAKADEHATPAQMRVMLQTLLAERFQLVVRPETKEARVFELVVSKSGSKMEEDSSEPGYLRVGGRGQMDGHRASMTQLALFLSTQLRQPVLDKTGLKANYNFKLAWTPDEIQAGRPGAGQTPDNFPWQFLRR
jgi:uncharacterized protein (TIGR03435 family)